jgi:hypothetical protein
MKVNMEYRLQKNIQKDWRKLLIPSSPYPHLTSYPATDYVVPGIAHAAGFQSFYVPIYGTVDMYNIEKKGRKLHENNQEGSGESESNSKLEPTEKTSSEIPDNSLENPIVFNERKRKLLGDAVFESFAHPQSITTKTVVLDKPVKSEEKKTVNENSIGHGKQNLKNKRKKEETEDTYNFKFF